MTRAKEGFFLAASPLVSSQSSSSQNNARKTSGAQGIQWYATPKILKLQVTKDAISCILEGVSVTENQMFKTIKLHVASSAVSPF